MHPSHDRVGFVLRLGRALHAYGTPSHRLEETLARVAERLGVPGQFFATPTSLIAAFGPVEEQRTHLLRLDPGDTDLERMARIDRIGGEVLEGKLTPEQGSARIEAAQSAPQRYASGLQIVAFGLSSAAATRFLGGGLREVAVAGVIGLIAGALQVASSRSAGMKRVFAPLAAAIAAAIATIASRALGGLAISTATLGGILVLVPGLTLTVAMAELSARHLVAGTARLAGAGGTFLGIAFGVALGGRIAVAAFGPAMPQDPTLLPAWTELIALLVAPLTFTVLMRAHPAAIPAILSVGILAFVAGRIGAQAFGPELGIFIAAFVAAGASNLIARRINRPVSITLVPALLLIVPGSVGFRSLASLLDRSTVDGIETAFRMTLLLTALVTGLFAAQIIAPAKRWSE